MEKFSEQPGTACYNVSKHHCKVAIERINHSPLLFPDLHPVNQDTWIESYFSPHHCVSRIKGFV